MLNPSDAKTSAVFWTTVCNVTCDAQTGYPANVLAEQARGNPYSASQQQLRSIHVQQQELQSLVQAVCFAEAQNQPTADRAEGNAAK